MLDGGSCFEVAEWMSAMGLLDAGMVRGLVDGIGGGSAYRGRRTRAQKQ